MHISYNGVDSIRFNWIGIHCRMCSKIERDLRLGKNLANTSVVFHGGPKFTTSFLKWHRRIKKRKQSSALIQS
jgi:hypothetical protein